MERRGITGIVDQVMQRYAILVPLDGAPTLITHEISGLKPGAEVTFNEVIRGARRKTWNIKNKENKCATIW